MISPEARRRAGARRAARVCRERGFARRFCQESSPDVFGSAATGCGVRSDDGLQTVQVDRLHIEVWEEEGYRASIKTRGCRGAKLPTGPTAEEDSK